MSRLKRVVAVSIIAMTLISVAMYVRNHQMKESLRERIIQGIVGDCVQKKIQLEKFIPDKYTTMCIQLPYMSQSGFEKDIGKKVSGYEVNVNDGVAYWWLFDAQDNHLVVEKMPRIRTTESINFDEAMCYQIKKTVITNSSKNMNDCILIEEK